MIEAISELFKFLGAGPRGDFWNVSSTLIIYFSLVFLSFRFYKKTDDEFFNFLGIGFIAFIMQKIVLFFAVGSMHIWHLYTPDQLEPWFPPMEHFFETIALLFVSLSFCYISLLFRGKKVKMDTSIFTPWENKDREAKIINYIFFIGIISAFIGYLIVSNFWMDFFSNIYTHTGKTTTFGQHWGDIIIEIVHAGLFFFTALYIAIRNYPLREAEYVHIITSFIIAMFAINFIGHSFHIYNMYAGEMFNELTDSVKRVSEFIGAFFLFGIVYFRLSDRLDKKKVKLEETLAEVRAFTASFLRISSDAAKKHFLDLNIKMPEIRSDKELQALSTSVMDMLSSINRREDSIQASSQELQVLNEELSAAYEELSKLYSDQESHIEELTKYQNELLAEKNKVDAILASIGDGLSIQDTDYNVIYANDFYSDMFGRNVVGTKCYNTYERRDAICEGCPVQKSFETGEVVRAVRGGVDKSNTRIFVDITASPVRDENGVIIAGIELVKDITKRVALEEQLKRNIDDLGRANDKLVKMDKLKSNFVGMASHELRTPLTMIKGYSELLMFEKQGRLDSVTHDMVKNIYESAERLNGIISDILDISRMDDNRLYLNRQKNDIYLTVNQAVNDLKHYAEKRSHEIKVTAPDTDAEKINFFFFDANRLYQVFTNLIGNAIKFTPDGGLITLSIKKTPKGMVKEDALDAKTLLELNIRNVDWIRICVKDNGIGIDKSEHKQIFDRFYEIGSLDEHASSKSEYMGGGAGLGLSIAKGIVDAHTGVIWVESEGFDEEARNGTAFNILLPYLKSENEEGVQTELPFMTYDI